MRPSSPCATAKTAFLSIVALTACITDSVQPDIYGQSARPQPADARAQEPKPELGATADEGDEQREDEQRDDVQAGAPPRSDGGAQQTPVQASPSAGCDLSGHWLITQRTIAQGLGVKQAGLWWFYYQLEQSGSDLSVKQGFVCGSEVIPVDVLAARVEFSASFPAITSKNSHAGRRGKSTTSGTSCAVSFARSYSVVGATASHYADPNQPLPTLEQQAKGSTPGWEDWDADGQPAVSLKVSGIVQGTRYTVLRVFSEWAGTIAAGASNFKLPVTQWGQQEAVLGVTSDLLKSSGVNDPDPKLHFAQFAKLTADQVAGDHNTICSNIRKLAKTLTVEASK